MSDYSSLVPSPPEADASTSTDVIIRTMAGDLALLGETGGSSPQGESVTITFSHSAVTAGVPRTASDVSAQVGAADDGKRTQREKQLMWIGIAGAGAVIFFLIGYFVIPVLFPSGEKKGGEAAPAPKQPISLPGGGGSGEPVFFGHESFFLAAADQIAAVTLASGPDAPSDYRAELGSRIAEVGGSGDAFFELTLKKADGHQPAWTEFLSLINAQLLDPKVFQDRFEQDFTAFAFRDKNGLSPGYALKLKRGNSPLALRSTIQRLEANADAIANLFYVPPGNMVGGFTDAQVLNQPARKASFSSSGAVFVYGWFHNSYLIVSTSEEGLRRATLSL